MGDNFDESFDTMTENVARWKKRKEGLLAEKKELQLE